MILALAQISSEVGAPQVNLEKFERYAELAKLKNAQLVIFPEMSDTGYVMSEIPNCSNPWPGLVYNAASQAATKHSIYLVCGISEKTNQGLYNSLACFAPDGKLVSSYRKTHLFSPAPVCEDRCFKAGNKLTRLDIEEFNFGLSICYDLRFPELYRSLTLQGANALINAAAWPKVRLAHWDCLSMARAIENQAFFIGVNRVGTDAGLTFGGSSRIISPTGELLALGHQEHEELVVGQINIDAVTNFRATIPALTSRRLEVYQLD